jgi:hypothetical protein
MAKRRVNSDELNLRSSAGTGDNIIATLRKGQAVETSGDANANGWIKTKAKVNGSEMQGFVKASLLRGPASDAKEALMEAAITEWFRFEKGTGLEHKSPFFKFVGEMWDAIGMDLDGKDRDVPWSAAYISWIVRKAGTPYDGFKFAAAHARYIHQAIKARLNETESPFWGFRLNEHAVQLGDLICQWRENPITYDQAKNSDSYFSHCDVVVEINGAGIRALGGNNSQTVGFKTYARNPAGFLKAENNVFAILRNNR